MRRREITITGKDEEEIHRWQNERKEEEVKPSFSMISGAFQEVMAIETHFERVKNLEEDMKNLKELMHDMKEMKEAMKGMKKEKETGSDDESRTDEMKKIRETMKELQREVLHLKQRDNEHEQEKRGLMQEIGKLTTENSALKMRLDRKDLDDSLQKEKIEKIKSDQEGWRNSQDRQVDLKKIIQEQQEEQRENLEKVVIKVMKSKEEVLRNVVDKKKCAIVFGMTEKHTPIRSIRQKEESMKIKELIKVLNEESEDLEEEIDEIKRMGKYTEGGKRPVRIKFKSQTTATEVLNRTGKLNEREEYKTVWIQKDLNKEERAEMKELCRVRNEKNEQRTEEEKMRFYWKIRDGKLKKWYLERKK